MTEFRFIDVTRPWVPDDAYLERMQIAKKLKLAAQQLDDPPKYETNNRVRNRGQRLSRIFWKGRQWAVTSYGLECRNGKYPISKDRLWENETDHGWVRHMSDKDWVDLPDFAEALRVARHHHHQGW
jgi:hypothetical protein